MRESGSNPSDVTAAGAARSTVTVSGSGAVSAIPDVADVLLGVSAQKPTVAAAQAAAAVAMTAAIAAIRKSGIADRDIATINVSLNPVYDQSPNRPQPRLIGHEFSNTVRVTVRDVAKLAAVVDDAIAAGATTVDGISFRVDDPKPMEARARQLAMADARARADELAAAAGVAIKGVASIVESIGSSGPAPRAVMMMAKGFSTPIQPGAAEVEIEVTVAYLIG